MQIFLLILSFLIGVFFLALETDWRNKRNNDNNLLYMALYIGAWVLFSRHVERLLTPVLGNTVQPDWLLTLLVALTSIFVFRFVSRYFVGWAARVWPWKA